MTAEEEMVMEEGERAIAEEEVTGEETIGVMIEETTVIGKREEKRKEKTRKSINDNPFTFTVHHN